MSEAFPTAQFTTGTDEVANGSEEATIIAAPGAGKVIRVLGGIVTVTLAATGGGGLVKLEDGSGGTAFVKIDADAVGFYPFNFGPRGYPLTANTLLNLTVDSAGTNEATATATITAYVV